MNDDTLTIKRSYRDRGPLPVYMQYNGQNRPQPAYLQLDADGTVSVDYSGEVGGAVPMRVWNGVDIRWTIPPELTVAGIDELINALAPLLAEFHEHHAVEWDDGNQVGRMDTRAREIGEDITAVIESGEWEAANVADAADWCAPVLDEIREDYRRASDKDAYLDALREEEYARNGVFLVGLNALRRDLEPEAE